MIDVAFSGKDILVVTVIVLGMAVFTFVAVRHRFPAILRAVVVGLLFNIMLLLLIYFRYSRLLLSDVIIGLIAAVLVTGIAYGGNKMGEKLSQMTKAKK